MRLGRNIIVKSFANSIIDKTLMDPDLKVKLHIIKTRGSYPYYYFTESDVVSLVDKQLQKGYLPILFWGAYNTIRRSLVEYLILDLNISILSKGLRTMTYKKSSTFITNGIYLTQTIPSMCDA